MTPRELMTEYLSAAKRGDWETAFGYFEDDIVVHIPGRSTFAGDHRGKDAAVEYIQTIRDHYRDGEIQLELIDMLVSTTASRCSCESASSATTRPSRSGV